MAGRNFKMVSGDAKTLRVTITDPDGNPVNLSAVQAITWQLAKSVSKPAELTKTLASGITITDAANGVIEIALENDDTAGLKGGYVHEIELTDTDGDKGTVLQGKAAILEDLIT